MINMVNMFTQKGNDQDLDESPHVERGRGRPQVQNIQAVQ
jgi:hypothetical protein